MNIHTDNSHVAVVPLIAYSTSQLHHFCPLA